MRRAAWPAMGAALLAATAAVASAGEWRRVRSPHFELLSDASVAEAERAALRLERFRTVLRVAAPVPLREPEPPLVVLLMADAGTFRSLRPRPQGRTQQVDGFVQGGLLRTFVVVHLAHERADPLETLHHEYVHVALNGALPAQPLWVAEGLAELYSDWREEEDQVRMAAVRPGHVRLLRAPGALPLERLLAAGYTTAEFLQDDTRQRLYAQSWALLHRALIRDGAAGRQALLALLEAIAQGSEPTVAFRSAFGDLREAESRLQRHLDEAALYELRLAVPPEPPPALTSAAAPPGLVDALLGEILLGQERDLEARRRFEAALEADPAMAAAHEGLAHLALRRGRWEQARQRLDLARRGRPDDAVALFRGADLLLRESWARAPAVPEETERAAVAALEKAVALAPHFADAVDLLARLRPDPLGQRIQMVERALALNPGRGDLALTLAGLYVSARDLPAASAALVRAREQTRDDAQAFLAEHLLKRLARLTAGTRETTGRLTALECLSDGALDFVVEEPPVTGTKRAAPLRLRAPRPESVLLHGPAGDPLQTELVCGPQQAPVRVRYRPGDEPAGGRRPAHDGVLLTLRFLRPA